VSEKGRKNHRRPKLSRAVGVKKKKGEKRHGCLCGRFRKGSKLVPRNKIKTTHKKGGALVCTKDDQRKKKKRVGKKERRKSHTGEFRSHEGND